MSISLRNESGTLERVAGFSDVDSILSPTSKNPIMNKSVYNALALKIEKTVTDLVNYYDTSQVYNKTEVRELIGAINTLTIEVVNTLPSSDISSTTIYFVGPASGTNTYDEYVYVNNAWVKIGDTQIDLTDYVTSTALTTVLQSYYTKTAVDALLANYYTKTEANNLLDAKQDNLTFDDSPTTGSSNPVKSGGVYTALNRKQDTLTFDSTPTADSNNPVTSDGIKDAIDDIYQQITPYVQSVSNPNLLDNPWFTINQRGITDSWNTQFSVGVDRWAKSSDSSSTLEVTTDGIAEVDGKAFSIYQVLDNTATNYESIKRLYGKTLMLSVLFSDGTIETGSYNLPLSDYRPSTNQIRTFINNSTRIEYARIESFAVGNVNLAIRVKAGNVIRAVKLEIGTVSTLINDTAPNYQQELAKCQRYFQRIRQAGSLDTLCMATYRNDYTLRTVLPLTVPMRAAPSATVNGTVSDYTNSGLTMAKISQPVTNGGAVGISFNISKSGVTWNNGVSKCITPDSTDFYIDFSADL